MKPGINSNFEINRPLWKKFIKSFFNLFGLEILRTNNFLQRRENLIVELDNDIHSKELIEKVNPYINSATIPIRWSLIQIMRYLNQKKIDGDLLECGVFRGGSLAIICLLAEKYEMKKQIYAYDTFGTGHTIYTDYDKNMKTMSSDIDKDYSKLKEGFFPSLEDVKNNLIKLGVKDNYMPTFIKGKVENTLYIESNLPTKIALARIDTDLYDSTKHELEVYYPRIVSGGILHINDYGGCAGVKKAVDEYFADKKVWMHRIDYTCRMIIKD
tara:strand:- start:2669 stop:3478 length:810 start_codon:yes stop_codon:yes gene_type:complete